jgi:ABC-type uncharacterized transport system involved in gliding motility auxiliary subunit
MASKWLKARQTRYAAYATTYILVVLAVVVIANFLGKRYNKTYDATANKRYSLSSETQKLVDGLQQDATITYFNQTTHFGQGRDLLDQYAELSPKIRIDFVDPVKDPEIGRADNITDIPAVTVTIGDRTTRAVNISEEGITGALIRDIKTNTRTICFVAGSGEHPLEDGSRNGLARLKILLAADSYETQTIDLVSTASVPAECTAVVVAGPIHDYGQPEVDALKAFVQNGGRALFLLDPPLKMGDSPIGDNDALSAVLTGWGVTPDKDLVLDFNPVGQSAGLGAQEPLVTQYNESQPIGAGMRGVATAFPITRSLTLAANGNSTVDQIFSSSGSSIATSNLTSPRIDIKDPNNKRGPFVLAAAGTVETGNPKKPGRFVVFGSSRWATNGGLSINGNSDLAANTINWLCSDEDLISIRPKSPDDRRLAMNQSQLIVVRVVSQFVLPLIVIIAGIIVWWKRR